MVVSGLKGFGAFWKSSERSLGAPEAGASYSTAEAL